jgi:hypothetical protein
MVAKGLLLAPVFESIPFVATNHVAEKPLKLKSKADTATNLRINDRLMDTNDNIMIPAFD